jgi:hypothetical protein
MDDPTPNFDAPSRPPMRFRRTRIATSVFFGVLSLILLMMWVRSYWYFDQVRHSVNGATYAGIDSMVGRIRVSSQTLGNHLPSFTGHSSIDLRDLPQRQPKSPTFSWIVTHSGRTMITFPHWLPLVVTAGIATICWLPIDRRCNLRTLFLATTLVAVLLGLGVWLARYLTH